MRCQLPPCFLKRSLDISAATTSQSFIRSCTIEIRIHVIAGSHGSEVSREYPLWMRHFVLQKKLLQFFQTKDYKIQKILKDTNFILQLSYLSDILGVVNHSNCYLQKPWSNIVIFAIKLTTSRVGKVRLASHMRLFDPQDVVLQLFVRNAEDCFLQLHLHPPFPVLVWSSGRRLFCCSLTHLWQILDCTTFPQVALSMKILPILRHA